MYSKYVIVTTEYHTPGCVNGFDFNSAKQKIIRIDLLIKNCAESNNKYPFVFHTVSSSGGPGKGASHERPKIADYSLFRVKNFHT